MSDFTPITRRNDEVKHEALDKCPQAVMELEGNTEQSRGINISSQRNALMERMRLLRISRDGPSDLVLSARSGPNGYASRSRAPRFGCLSSCNIDDDTEEKLWDLEARRLLHGLESNQNFLKAVSGQMIPEGITSSGFAQLERFADRLLCILAIYGLHDQNALIELERYRRNRATNRDIYIISHSRRLLEVMDPSRQSKLSMDYDSSRNKGPNFTADNAATIMKEKTTLDVLDSELPEFYTLIDCLTVTVARITSLSPDLTSIPRLGSFWHDIMLSLLAKMSAKMKVLSHDLPGYLEAALRDTRGLWSPLQMSDATPNTSIISKRYRRRQRARSRSRSRSRGRAQLPRRYKSPRPASLSSEASMSDIDFDQVEIAALPASYATIRPEVLRSQADTYECNMAEVSALLFRLLWRILTDLRTRNARGHERDEFDISAVAYSTKAKGVSAMIYQDRQAQITGSSSPLAASMYEAALNVLLEDAASITGPSSGSNAEREQHSSSENTRSPRLKIEVPASSKKINVDYPISSMDGLIRTMIALSCMDPVMSDFVFKACVAVGETGMVAKMTRAARRYSTRVCLRHINKLGNVTHTSSRYQGKALSQSLFFERKGLNSDPPLQHRWMYLPWLASPTHVAQSSRHFLSTSWENAKHWEIEESAITIPCLRYTLSIMASCFLLVFGGLLSGFLVGERITGVDPFNLTMFSWIIAGFIVLVAKSIRVKDWPWRDFLRGRVTCRSVREIVSVTGLDAQDILVFLLSSEVRTPLRSRGPFNSVFTFIGDGDGFSIDIRPTLATLVSSGMMLVEVTTGDGPALVCVDLRPDASHRFHNSERHSLPQQLLHRQNQAIWSLVCTNPPRENGSEAEIQLQMREIRWERVVGIYDNEDCKIG